MKDVKSHWEKVYQTKKSDEVSWFQPHLARSLEMILGTGLNHHGIEVIDVGGGASTLVDDLLSHAFGHVSVLDISREALNVSKNRLGGQSENVTWIEGDVTQVDLPPKHYDVWHDRAVFHFLTSSNDCYWYVEKLKRALKPGGHVIMATFGPQGPTHCSGLDVARYSPQGLATVLGESFNLVASFTEDHKTPGGVLQQFIYCHFIFERANAK